MAIRLLSTAATGWRTTDHREEISDLLDAADGRPLSEVHRLALRASAALLSCHDETGISLDDWHEPRDLVEHLLGRPIMSNKTWHHVIRGKW